MRMIMAIMAVVAYTAMAGNDHAALTGNGTSGGLTITPSGFKLSSSTYTVEAWIRISTRFQNHPIMDQFVGNGTTGDWSFAITSQSGRYGIPSLFTRGLSSSEASNWLLASSQLPLDSWQHVAVAVDGSTVKFYLNGVLDKTHTITSGGATVPTASGTFRIGSANRDNNVCCKGNIADCRVWSVVRTAEEIAENRCVRLTGNEQGLAGYWPLDEGTGASVVEKVSGASSAIAGSGYSWADIPTPFVVCDVSANHVLVNNSGAQGVDRIGTGGFNKLGEAFSLECWFCPLSMSMHHVLFDNIGTQTLEGDIRMSVIRTDKSNEGDPGTLGFCYRGFGAKNWLYGKSKIPLYKWTHCAVTCDGDEVRLYVDGLLETSAVRTASSRITPSASSELTILSYTTLNSDSKTIKGKASDVRIWGRALSASEIASNRCTRLTGHEDGLVCYWPLGETGGSVATNYAPTALMVHDAALSDNYVFESCSLTPFVGHSGGMDDACVLSGGRFDTGMRIWYPSYTTEAWIRLNTYGNNVVFSQFASTYTSGDLRMTVNDQGKLSGFLRYFIDGNWVYSTATIPLKTWTHIALTYDGEKMKLYINGVKDSEHTGVAVTPNGFNTLYAGGTEDGTLGFDGRLSDLRVWDTARTDEEIAANYAKRLTGAEAHLQGYWPLGQASGNTVFNYSRQGIADGVAAGTLTWRSDTSTPFHVKGMVIIFR